MTAFFRCLLLLLLFAIPFAAQGQKQIAKPQFENYPAPVWHGRVASLDLGSHPLARTYRTLLRQQLKSEGVNFAGHYNFASVGCGTGCSVSAIIDARTGNAYFPREFSGWTSIVGDYEPPENEAQRMISR